MLVILDFQADAEQTQRMISASTNNELIELESLLKKTFEPKCERRTWHNTVALCRRKRTCLQLLIEAGADKDQAANDGATPLFMAAHEGHLDVVRHLVEVGAHKDQATNYGAGPLWISSTSRPS